jgi:hypothetical protein
MVFNLASHWIPKIISQFLRSNVNTSVLNETPCTDHWNFLHTEVQVISPPLTTCIIKALMLLSLQCNLYATWLLMKLWVLPESTKINKGCFPTLSVTLRVFSLAVPSKALRDRWGLWVTCSTSITPSPSLLSPSSSTTHKE